MAKKSVFNKPMREAKPARKIPIKIVEKPKPVSEPDFISGPLDDVRYKASFAIDHLRLTVALFKQQTGEQDVNRAALNLFLQDLEAAINRVAAVFEP